jgi:hypothetical protein
MLRSLDVLFVTAIYLAARQSTVSVSAADLILDLLIHSPRDGRETRVIRLAIARTINNSVNVIPFEFFNFAILSPLYFLASLNLALSMPLI